VLLQKYYDYINVGKTVRRGQKRWNGIYFDSYHCLPDILEKLHEDTVSTAYGLLVNICTVCHESRSRIFFSWYEDPTMGQASSLSRLYDD